MAQSPGSPAEPLVIVPQRRAVDETESRRANRADWDRYADEYQATHGQFLRDTGFVWSPEGTDEADLRVLGEVAGRDVLEIGCGAAQCSRWLLGRGARPVGLDLAHRQLQHGRRIDAALRTSVPTVCGTATDLPFADGAFDIAFSAFGALQFVADIEHALDETARVLRRGGRFAFSITHPIRWTMPDDPGPDGLTVTMSYFDRTPYVEVDDTGRPSYVEHHRTLGDWVGLLAERRFALTSLLEPEWPEGHERIWGGWGPLRGELTPGTAIFSAELR